MNTIDWHELNTYMRGVKRGRKLMIEKACTWLREHTDEGLYNNKRDEFIENFRKAMKK